jgi:hypothetical protein
VGRARRFSGTLSKIDPVADLEHHAAIHRQHPRPLALLGAGGGVGAHQGDLLADRLLHQLGGREQVEIEILFDDRHVRRAERHRLRLDLARHVGEFLARAAGGQVELPRVLHEREIVVVDRDGEIARLGLRRCCGGQDKDAEQQDVAHDGSSETRGRCYLVTIRVNG